MNAAPATSATPRHRAPAEMLAGPDLPPHPLALAAISLTGALFVLGAFKAMGWLLTFMMRTFA